MSTEETENTGSPEAELPDEPYKSMISRGVNDNVRQAIATVELSGGQVSAEAVEISNLAELGLIDEGEEIRLIIERHKVDGA